MKAKFLNILSCPECKSSLKITESVDEGGEIKRGSIECIKCKSIYVIENGIPVFTGVITKK